MSIPLFTQEEAKLLLKWLDYTLEEDLWFGCPVELIEELKKLIALWR